MTGESGDASRVATALRSLRRQRVVNLVMGGAVLALGIVGFLVIAADPASGGRTPTLLVVLVVTAVAGVLMTAVAARPVPLPVSSVERPERGVEQDGGWIRLAPDGSVRGSQSPFALSLTRFPILFAYLGIPFLSTSGMDVGVGGTVGLIGVVAAGVLIVETVVRRRNLSPWVSADGSAIRQRRREVAASGLTSASFFVSPLVSVGERNLVLILTGKGGFRAVVGLRRRGRLVLTDVETAVLVHLITQSSIALPRDPYDPDGRFAKALQGPNLTKEDAVALVEHPPGDGEPIRPPT